MIMLSTHCSCIGSFLTLSDFLLGPLDVIPDQWLSYYQEELSIHIFLKSPQDANWKKLNLGCDYICQVCICVHLFSVLWPFVGRLTCSVPKKIQAIQNYDINEFTLKVGIKTTKTNIHIQMRVWAAALVGLSKVSQKMFFYKVA